MLREIIATMKGAAETGVNDDTLGSMEYIRRCTLDVQADAHKGMRLAYTRSFFNGMHFFHLSISMRRPPYKTPAPFDHRYAKRVVPAFFAPHAGDVIVCRPETPKGIFWNNWHFRLFTDAGWKANGYRPLCKPGDPPRWIWAEYLATRFA